MSEELRVKVLEWLEFEADNLPVPEGPMTFIDPFKPILKGALNTIYLDPFGPEFEYNSISFNAEELGVTQANVREQLNNPDPQIRRLLGVERGLGDGLGVSDDFALRLIETLGNYGEIFERNLGGGSPLRIERGLNRLYTNGGILYAPPNR